MAAETGVGLTDPTGISTTGLPGLGGVGGGDVGMGPGLGGAGGWGTAAGEGFRGVGDSAAFFGSPTGFGASFFGASAAKKYFLIKKNKNYKKHNCTKKPTGGFFWRIFRSFA